MGRSRRGFTKEFKVDAIKLVTEQGYNLYDACAKQVLKWLLPIKGRER
jgi:transposase-like protein